ncbi:MAG TPA: asparagine--tRNA ligase [Candidatus Methanofastidiosa archaeon]|nr:asparagine--tRNA ligase [Candidatus Methanofastidiosa archaeon]
MKDLYIKDLPGKIGEDVDLYGWVYRKRRHGKLVFVVLRDSTGIVQVSVKKQDVSEDVFEAAKMCEIESSVFVKGLVREDERSPGGIELSCKELKVISPSHDFPIQEDTGAEALLDIRHLTLRSTDAKMAMRMKMGVIQGAREYFAKEGFTEVYAPIFVGVAGEGGGTLFSLDYFGQKAYLSQTAQLHLEAAIFQFENVYSLAPSFRAEKSRTRRHLTEFYHLEAEMAWCDEACNEKVEEGLVSHICNYVGDRYQEELKYFGQDPSYFRDMKPKFERISYDEAISILQGKNVDIEFGCDFGYEEEKVLTEDFEYPFFVKNYPKDIKAFYMKQEGDRAVCADLLAPGGYGEIIGGSQREDNLDLLVERILAEGESLDSYEWYLDLRRYGSVPHSGFGLGIERLVRWISKLEHIRECCLFPRTPARIYP